MAIPEKPKKTADDFIKGAKATKAEKKIGLKGRPKGPQKDQLSARIPIDLLEAVRKNAAGNQSYFVEMILRDYFKREGIDI